MPNLKIYTLPQLGLNGHLYVTEIGNNDPIDKNDKILLFVFDENVTDFNIEKIVLSALDDSDNDISDEVSFTDIELTGADDGAVYTIGLRPPDSGDDGSITITVLENAVEEGNPETSLTITYSDDFPQAIFTPLFQTDPSEDDYEQIVSVNSEEIWLRRSDTIHVYDWSGEQNTTLNQTLTEDEITLRLDNDSYLVRFGQKIVKEQNGTKIWESADILQTISNTQQAWTLTKDGRLLVTKTEGDRGIEEIPIESVHEGIIENDDLSDKTYAEISLSSGDNEELPNETWYITSNIDEIYIEPRSTGDHYIHVYDSGYNSVPEKWIPIASELITYAPLSIFIFQNLLFRYNTNKELEFIDIDRWRIPQAIGKIHPQEITPGQRIDLKKFIRYADDIAFDLGYKIPDWLSIEDDRYLVIAEDAPIASTSYVRIIGINHVGATPFHSCMFYVHVNDVTHTTPVWESIKKLPIRKDQKINLFEYVRGADTIETAYGSEFPEFLEITEGVLRVVDTGDSATLTLRAGTNDGFFSDKTIDVIVISDFDDFSILNVIDYNVEIESVDVTEHLVRENFPSINHSLDWVKLNQFKRGNCSVSLYSNAENNGLFNTTNPSSFWKTNDLNENGFLSSISVFVVLQKTDGESQRIRIFDGVIFDSDDSLNVGQLTLRCYDRSYTLKDTDLNDFIRGTPKVLELSPEQLDNTDPEIEGIYQLESSFGEIIPKRVKVWNNSTELILKEIENYPEGVVEDDTAFATDTEIKTQGGYLHDDVETPLLAQTETPYRYVSVAGAAEKYIKSESTMMTSHIQETDARGDAHISANGNLAFATERGRILKYPTYWVVDTINSKLYYLLSNPSNFIQDELVCLDLENETRQILYRFGSQTAALKLATTDFDTFVVMLEDKNKFDRSTTPSLETERIVKDDLDTSISETTQIVSYQESEDLYETIVPKNNDRRPLSALHYWTGVSGHDYSWGGVSEGDRVAFAYQDDTLLYRWAKESEFGVAGISSSNTITALFTETKDGYFNHLNFAFDIVGDDIYFAFVSGTDTGSTLTIKKRSGGSNTTIFTKTYRFNELADLDSSGNTWLGVQELLVDGDNFYLIVPVSRNNRDISTGAGVILYRYSTITQQLTVVRKSDFVQSGPCMLTKFDDNIYFVESPSVTNEYPTKNRNITYETSEAKGFLFCIRTSVDGNIETVGNLYFDEGQAYNAQLPMKALEFNEDLNFILGYGDIKTISSVNSESSKPENWQWLSFGKKYRYKVPVLKKEGDSISALTQIAGTTGGTLSINKDIVSIQNRVARGALTTYWVTSTDTTIPYEFPNTSFPENGFILIGSELVKYTGKTDTHFTGITRGELSTIIQTHAKGELITFVKRTIEDREKIHSTEPYLQVTVSLDSPNLYNSVSEGSPQKISLKDDTSREKFGDLPLQLNLGTTHHELPFSTFISMQYLERFKNLAYIINARVRSFFSMNLGEFVCFKCLRNSDDIDGYLIAMQVMDIQTDGRFTTLRGRQVTPTVTTIEKPDLLGLHVSDGSGALFFAGGAENVIGWYGDEMYIDTMPSFDVSELGDLKFTQYKAITPIVFPEAKSPIGNSITYSISPALEQGFIFDPRTRTLSGTPNAIQEQMTYTYTAADSEGQEITLTRTIQIVPGVRRLRNVSDGANAMFFADASRNIPSWYGH